MMKCKLKKYKNNYTLPQNENKKLNKYSAIKICIVNIIINIALTVFKFFGGLFGNSYALLADSFHSLSDVFIGIILLIGIKISSKKPDETHQFGYNKIESICAIILSFILFDIGLLIGYNTLINLINGDYKIQNLPTNLALITSIISITFKFFMFFFTLFISKITFSNALKADAWHQFSDALSSIGIFIGIIGAMLGFEILDIIAGLLICLVIIKVSVEIFIDSVKKISDHCVPLELSNQIKNNIINVSGVLELKSLKTRISGNEIFVEIEIYCDNNLTIENSYIITNSIKSNIMKLNHQIKSCNIYILPK